MRSWFVLPTVTLVSLALAATARAEPTPQEAILAQTLFDDARAKMAAGSFAEACPKFAESYHLDPGGGTLLNLGMCHEAEGKFASAYAELSEALSQAIRDGRAERQKTAREHLATVTPRLSRLRVHVAPGAPAGLQVKVDGVALAPAAWDVPVPMDPGEHTVTAAARGRIASENKVRVEPDGSTKDFEVGVLAIDPAAHDDAPPPPPPWNGPEPKSSGAALRIAGYSGLVVGGASLIVGGIFAVLATTTWSSTHAACPNNVCPSQSNANDGKRAGAFADVATVTLIVGGVLAAGGLILVLVAPSGRSTYVAPTTSGFVLGGTF